LPPARNGAVSRQLVEARVSFICVCELEGRLQCDLLLCLSVQFRLRTYLQLESMVEGLRVVLAEPSVHGMPVDEHAQQRSPWGTVRLVDAAMYER